MEAASPTVEAPAPRQRGAASESVVSESAASESAASVALTDLPTHAFLALTAYFGPPEDPVPFSLRHKASTQDDPFDELIASVLEAALPPTVGVLRAPGANTSPDLVLIDRVNPPTPDDPLDPSRLVALEVKRLSRTAAGPVARASGLDYNTTPPCDRVLLDAVGGPRFEAPGFYLYACVEPASDGIDPGPGRDRWVVTGLVLTSGALINKDVELYRSILLTRTKTIGIGTYGDGADRVRPMLIFANPLGLPILDHAATLLHERDDLAGPSGVTATPLGELHRAGVIHRNPPAREGDGHLRGIDATSPTPAGTSLSCYRSGPAQSTAFELTDPFPTPDRSASTTPRRYFRVDLTPQLPLA